MIPLATEIGVYTGPLWPELAHLTSFEVRVSGWRSIVRYIERDGGEETERPSVGF